MRGRPPAAQPQPRQRPPGTVRALVALIATTVLLAAAAAPAAAASYLDITVPVAPGLPVFQSPMGLPKNWLSRHQLIADGDVCNQASIILDAHTGTHVDAPLHFVDKGAATETLDLHILIGKTLVVDFPHGSNITGEALKKLKLPVDVERVLFKTDNSAKLLMHQRAFVPSYTSLDSTGAAYITQHTGIRLVGIDYLSIGCLEDIVETHRILLGKPVIAVEGLDLSGVEAGYYHQICLPARFVGSDGAPIRCVLQPLAEGGEAAAAAAAPRNEL